MKPQILRKQAQIKNIKEDTNEIEAAILDEKKVMLMDHDGCMSINIVDQSDQRNDNTINNNKHDLTIDTTGILDCHPSLDERIPL